MTKDKYLIRQAQRIGGRCKPMLWYEGISLLKLRAELLFNNGTVGLAGRLR